MATITVRDAENAEVEVQLPLAPGRSAAATSRPVALSTEDKSALDAVNTALDKLATKDDSGAAFSPDNMPQTLGYTDGALTTVSVSNGVDTWVQTLTYTDGALTGVSAWVKQ